ncbi:hypothetical protein J2S43_005982 [Catenuloplanes nepalensis]|uniref:Uncharacterized protein n=1 Tax=Catenuloplanes nepalensis TaxID=587533 RepID=A0ABT9N1A0_9ACTN|nr:hypothetical protein [Catenuloplanes nepalensis]MDP9797470.1 hypothetical protein [Catenuloplanes nepalensis]
MVRTWLWRISIWVATGTLGAWVADLYVPGFYIDGPLAARVALGCVLAVLTMAVSMGLTIAMLVPLAPLMMIGAQTRIVPALDGDEPLKSEVTAHPVVQAFGSVVIFMLLTAVVTPLSFFLALQGCRLIGIPVGVTGGWPAYFTAALALTAVQASAQSLRPSCLHRRALRIWAVSLLTFLACAAVLWIVAGHHDLPGILLLAAMFISLRLTVPERWGVATQLPADIAAVYVLIWCSGWLTVPVASSAAWAPLLTALAITALTLPLRLLSPPPPPDPPSTPGPGRYRRVGQT